MLSQQAAKREVEYWDRKGKLYEAKLKKQGRRLTSWQNYNDELYKKIDEAASLGAIKRKVWEDKLISEASKEAQSQYDFDSKRRRSYLT